MADHITTRVRQSPDDVEVTRRCGPVHRVGVVTFLTGVDVQASLQQQIHYRQMSRECCEMQQRVLVGPVTRLEFFRMRIKKLRELVEVAVTSGAEQLAIDGQRIDVRLERAPGWKSVPLGEIELGVG